MNQTSNQVIIKEKNKPEYFSHFLFDQDIQSMDDLLMDGAIDTAGVFTMKRERAAQFCERDAAVIRDVLESRHNINLKIVKA